MLDDRWIWLLLSMVCFVRLILIAFAVGRRASILEARKGKKKHHYYYPPTRLNAKFCLFTLSHENKPKRKKQDRVPLPFAPTFFSHPSSHPFSKSLYRIPFPPTPSSAQPNAYNIPHFHNTLFSTYAPPELSRVIRPLISFPSAP